MCIDSDTEKEVLQPESPPPVYTSAQVDTTSISSKKGKKPRMPTPHSDSEDVTAGHMSMSLLQMIFFVPYLLHCFLDNMSLKTPQKSKKPINHYPPIDEILDLSIPSHRSKCLPALRYVYFYLLFFNFTDVQSIYRPVTISYGDKAFWTGDVHKTVLNIPAYNMHPG